MMDRSNILARSQLIIRKIGVRKKAMTLILVARRLTLLQTFVRRSTSRRSFVSRRSRRSRILIIIGVLVVYR